MLARRRQSPLLLGSGLALCLVAIALLGLRPMVSSQPTPAVAWPSSPRSAEAPIEVPAPAAAALTAPIRPPQAAPPPAPLELVSPVALASAGGLLLASDVSRDQVLARPLQGGPWRVFAGSGFAGYAGDGGPAAAAELDAPAGLAADGLGNLYIADSSNHAVREVSVAGSIETVAGSGLRGFAGDGGPATEARLDSPAAVAVGSDGSLYIADKGNNRIRRVDRRGVISTVAGTGLVTVVAGSGGFGFSGDGGLATAAQLSAPEGVLAGPGGELYIADTGNDRIRVITTSGLISTIAGSGANGYFGDGGAATSAGMTAPVGLALDGRGRLFIAERDGQVVRRVSGGVIAAVAGAGKRGSLPGELDDPGGLALVGGTLYLAETGAGRLTEIGPIS